LAFLEKNGIYHGDIRATSIFYIKNEKSFHLKLGDPTILTINNALIECMTQGHKKGIYLSPILF
jgi:hypothetical protein